jgi:dienelactone hydrolase
VARAGELTAEVLLFHHAQGLTAGCVAFADSLRAAGHVVHAPDLYEGRTFGTLDEGVAHAGEVGFGTILERGRAAADGLPDALVYVGLSLGVLPAQLLAQTRPGARGAVLVSACVPPEELGAPWPDGVPVQIHMMEDDELVVSEGDLDAARAFTEAELFLYPGEPHLFVDSSLPDYDAAATALVMERVRGLLARVS